MTRIGFLKVTLALVLTNVAYAKTAPSRAPIESVIGEYVVVLNQNTDEIEDLEVELGAKIIDQIRDDAVLVRTSLVEKQTQALERLRRNEFVVAADPNFIYRAIAKPNDPEFFRLWGLSNGGGLDTSGTRGVVGVDIGAERAWDITTGSKNVVVAVIDTGVDFKIPDLASNAWVNEKEKNGKPGVDDDGNGYVDDINGYDFVSGDGDPTDDQGHGSHCSGTIGARGNDGVGVAGVNWNVQIMAVKFLDKNGSGTLANAIKSIDYARLNGAQIMSNSWGGGGYNDLLRIAIRDARNAGSLFVVAAGNDSQDTDENPSYPSGYDVDNIVSVAAINNRGEVASFSNFGKTSVDIAAPGVNILSTTPSGLMTYSGTSMAAPHVSGVAALLKAQNPSMKYPQIIDRLMKSARPLRSLNGKIASGGVVDAYYALSGETPPADPNDPERFLHKRSEKISTAHPYPNKSTQKFVIEAPGAKRVAVFFPRFDTEFSFDKVTFKSGSGEVLGVWSGKHDGEYSPIAEGSKLIMEFVSDDSVSTYGFDIDRTVYE